LVGFKNSAAAFAVEFFVQPPPPKKIRLSRISRRQNFSLASRQHRKKIRLSALIGPQVENVGKILNIGADNCIYQKNLSNCHTSIKIGRHMHYSLLFHNGTLAMQIFKMAAIFQDGRHFRYVTPYNSDIVGSSGALP